MARTDSIHAITLCINYSDYLANTLGNRQHFEKWTIVTCPRDAATIRLCEQEGLDLLVTDCLGPAAEAFDSAYSKGEILNWALDSLMPDNWIVLLDADTLLPKYFRERLDAMELTQRAIYGLYGRRDCLTWEQFAARVNHEPWEDFIGYSNGIMGYLQLFHARQPNNRYPRWKRRVERHDDLAFQRQFKPGLRRFLPMTAVHVGPARENWAGRKSAAFRRHASEAYEGPPSVLPAPSTLKQPSNGWTVVFGFDETWCPPDNLDFDRLLLVDWFGLSVEMGLSLLDTDNRRRREIFLARFPEAHNHILPADNALITEFLQKNFVDLIILNFEPDSTCLARLCGILRSAKQAVINLKGYFFGYPDWPDATAAIALMFGPPDTVYENGQWNKTIETSRIGALAQVHPIMSMDPERSSGILCVVRCEEDLQALAWVTRIYRVPCAAAVLAVGGPTIDILLAQLNIISVEPPINLSSPLSLEMAVCQTCLLSPFYRTFYFDLQSEWPAPEALLSILSEADDCLVRCAADEAAFHFVWNGESGLAERLLDAVHKNASGKAGHPSDDNLLLLFAKDAHLRVRQVEALSECEFAEKATSAMIRGTGIAHEATDFFLSWVCAESAVEVTESLPAWGINGAGQYLVHCDLPLELLDEITASIQDAAWTMQNAGPDHGNRNPQGTVLSWLREHAKGSVETLNYVIIPPGAMPLPGADLYKLFRPQAEVAVESSKQFSMEPTGLSTDLVSAPVFIQSQFLIRTLDLRLPHADESLGSWLVWAADQVSQPVTVYPAGKLGWVQRSLKQNV